MGGWYTLASDVPRFRLDAVEGADGQGRAGAVFGRGVRDGHAFRMAGVKSGCVIVGTGCVILDTACVSSSRDVASTAEVSAAKLLFSKFNKIIFGYFAHGMIFFT